jgi:periplasmic protein TonB
MGDSLSVRFSKIFQTTSEENWIVRVKQNARAFFELRRAALAHGGPSAFDLIEERPAPGTLRRQAGSLIVHAVVIGGLVLAGGHAMKNQMSPLPTLGNGAMLLPPLKGLLVENRPDPGGGKGSNHDLLPPTTGSLAPLSNIVLVRPHLPDEKLHAMPVAPTVYDADAVMPTQPVNDLGLPWMKDRNNSNGNDGGNTIGTKKGDTMGSSNGDYEGESGGQRYAPGAYPVKCVYCPDPEYTDEARHEKLQGSVTMRVLVTPDGRAGQIRIVKGLGLGLDERAVDKVRTWRFQPARDANKNAIAEWVTVEATYRLF